MLSIFSQGSHSPTQRQSEFDPSSRMSRSFGPSYPFLQKGQDLPIRLDLHPALKPDTTNPQRRTEEPCESLSFSQLADEGRARLWKVLPFQFHELAWLRHLIPYVF